MPQHKSRRRNKIPATRKAPTVAIGYCHPSHMDAAFHTSLVLTMMRDKSVHNQIDSVIGVISGPRVATARNDIVESFLKLESKPEWLWMVDADMVWPPDILEQVNPYLMEPEAYPFLSGLAFIYSITGQIKPNIMVLAGEENLPQTIWKYPRNSLCSIDAVGAAFMFVHRSVLEKVQEKWGDHPHTWFQESTWKGYEIGEDVTFCLRVRELGIPIHVHTGIIPGHMKPGVIDEESYDQFRKELDDSGEEAVKAHALSRRHLVKRVT